MHSLRKETPRKPSNVAAATKPFLQCVCYLHNLLWWIFYILCDNWKTLFFVKVYSYFERSSNRHVAAFFKEVFLKRSVFYAIRSSRPEVSVKKVFLEISQSSHENICARVSFIKSLLKRNSGAGVFLWILRNI